MLRAVKIILYLEGESYSMSFEFGDILTDNKQNSAKYSKSDQSFLRNFNTKKILNIFWEQGPMSRIDIAAISYLDKKSITNLMNELLDKRQVMVLAKQQQGKGRPKEIISLNGNFSHSIGLDVSTTYIAGIILDFSGKVLCRHYIEIKAIYDSDELLSHCDQVIQYLLSELGMSLTDIDNIGISLPGYLDSESGLTVLSENLPSWHNVTVKKLFAEKYHKDIFIDDCSRLMALAELWYSKDKDCKNFIVFDLGYGIGCGIVINGEIFAGGNGKSGEVGHTIVKPEGPKCTCGRRGCIESLSSGWALLKQGSSLVRKNPDSILAKIVQEKAGNISIHDIILASKQGDESVIKLLEAAGKYISISIANSVSLFNPSKIILGGNLIQNNDVLVNSIFENVKVQTLPDLYVDTTIVKSTLGVYASALGAATMCMRKYYK